jgi:hypothetical protein
MGDKAIVAVCFVMAHLLLIAGESCLHRKGLVKPDIRPGEVLENYGMVCEVESRNFGNVVLGYVTPWNPEGKRIARQYAPKFDIIAPVWYNVNLEQLQYNVSSL